MCRECDLVTLCVFGLWRDAKHRWLLGSYLLSEWLMGENKTVTFVDFQLSDSAHRQSRGKHIRGAGQNVGVLNLDDGDTKAAERDTDVTSS